MLLRFTGACPHCGSPHLGRTRRQVWMRGIPGSRRYRCEDCGRRTLVLGRAAVRLGPATPLRHP
ncbi:MAG: phage terminase large subunit family protein [Gammaproteobacteria bacterium]|nr:phage terminase large subunit family protein [Gammaproteobacteria bacterium]